MQLRDSLTTLFQHHRWANLRLLAACAQLNEEQLAATGAGAFGSIQETLNHITRAEYAYLSRISTGQQYVYDRQKPPLTVAEMNDLLAVSGAGLIEWAGQVQAEDVVPIDWDGVMRDVPKTILLTQAINHATEHRDQVMTILTQLGIEPPDLSAWSYFDEVDNE